MTNEFIRYEQALALKELGFDEPCFKVKLKSKPQFDYTQSDYDDFPEQKELEVGVPLYQQAFRWFREKYNLDHEINKHKNFESFMCRYGQNGLYEIIEEGIETYEEAELICLEKLIEIVKL